jgi:hypothetical protein
LGQRDLFIFKGRRQYSDRSFEQKQTFKIIKNRILNFILIPITINPKFVVKKIKGEIIHVTGRAGP